MREIRRKTNEVFTQEVYDLVGDEYEFIDTYIKTHTKIRVIHMKCEKEYSVTPANFLSGSRCPHCKGNMKKTHEQFLQEVDTLGKGEYTLLGKYKNSRTKIKVKHKTCGNEYYLRPDHFVRGARCPECAEGISNKKRTKTDEEFKKEVKELEGNDYIFLEEYIQANAKIRVKHSKCGHEYKVTPSKFLHGRRCPKCQGTHRRTTKEFKKEVYELVGEEYIFKGTLGTMKDKMEVEHKTCGNVYEVTPTNFLHDKNRCPMCVGGVLKTQEQFEHEVYLLVGKEYKVVGKYQGQLTDIGMYHEECGNVIKVKPSKFLHRGTRCSECTRGSVGEREIKEYLDEEGEEYEYQKTFEGLTMKRDLRIDFYLPKYNLCIEFDGEQHYYPVKFFGGLDKFKKLKESDGLKNEYCEHNKINMLRIPYTELGNVGSIIEDYIVNNYL